MSTLEKIKDILFRHKDELAANYQVKEIGIFGSYARAENGKKSDLDILVDFRKPIGMFKFLELEEYLQSLTGIKIDLVSRKALKPALSERILHETVLV